MNKTDIKYRVVSTLLKTVARLPLGVLYLFSDFACFIMHKIVKYRVKVVRKNLSMTFPEKTEKELRKIENEFYHHLFDVFVEAGKLAHISDEEMSRRVQVEGIEVLNDALKNGKSVVAFLGHYCNWEWVTSSAMLMDRSAEICEIYHPLRDKVFDKLMLSLRSRFGTVNIPMLKSVRHLLKIKNDGGLFVCGFIADQRPFTPELKHWTEFLGIETAYVNGGEVIGTKVGAEFLYAEMMPVKRGNYKLTYMKLEPLNDGEENPYTRAFLKKLEDSIRKNPPYWLWSHNRWKRKRTPENCHELKN